MISLAELLGRNVAAGVRQPMSRFASNTDKHRCKRTSIIFLGTGGSPLCFQEFRAAAGCPTIFSNQLYYLWGSGPQLAFTYDPLEQPIIAQKRQCLKSPMYSSYLFISKHATCRYRENLRQDCWISKENGGKGTTQRRRTKI
jgi:hypothetical protein